ncbi:MAG: hypothetical protein HYZ53_24125 [Planctomycetes bacterium]|nr:hypothetical protein [Planctomycetota bacterium]
MPDPIDVTFADIVEKNGLATRAEIEQCFEVLEYAQTKGIKLSLADVMVDKGLLNRPVVEGIRREQLGTPAATSEPRLRTLGISPKEDAKLGNLVANNRFVSEAEFEECVGIRQQLASIGHPKLLTEILVEKGALREEVVESILEYIRSTRAIASPSATDVLPILNLEDLFFGASAIVNRLLSRATVQQAMALQRDLHARCGLRLRLGEVIVEKKMVTYDALQAILQMQQFEMEMNQAPVIRRPRISEAEDAALRALVEAGKTFPAEQASQAKSAQQTLESVGIELKLTEVFLLRGFLEEPRLKLLLEQERGKKHEEERRKKLLRYRKPALLAAGALCALGLVAFLGPAIVRAIFAPPPEPVVPAANPVLTAAEADAVLRQAEERARALEFGPANALLAKLYMRSTDPQQKAELQRRMEEWTEEALAFDEVITALEKWKGPRPVLPLSDGSRRELRRAGKGMLVFAPRAAGQPDEELPLRQLPPGDIAALLELLQLHRTRSLAVAAFCRDQRILVGPGRKALALLRARSDFAPARVAELLAGIVAHPLQPEELVVRDGELYMKSETPRPVTPPGGVGQPGKAATPAETPEVQAARLAAAVAAAAEPARAGRFGRAAALVRAGLKGLSGVPGQEAAELRAAAYEAMAGVEEKIAHALTTAPLKSPGKEFQELGVEGPLLRAEEAGLVWGAPPAERLLPWSRLTGAAVESLAAFAVKARTAEDNAALALWYAELGDLPRSKKAAGLAEAAGMDLAAIQPLLAAAEGRAQAKAVETLLDAVHTLVENRKFEEALARMAPLRDPAAAPPEEFANEIAWLASLVTNGAARALLARAQELEKGGKGTESLDTLDRLLRDCGATTFATRAKASRERLAGLVKKPEAAAPGPGPGPGSGPPPDAGDGRTAEPPNAGLAGPPGSLATTGKPRRLWVGTRTEAKGWWRFETPRFGIVSDETREDRMNRLAKLLEGARSRAAELLAPAKKDDRIARVIFFAAQPAYQAYAGTAESFATYDGARDELICWNAGDGAKDSDPGPLLREAWLQYLGRGSGPLGSWVAPAWLSAGIGDLFAAAKVERGGERVLFEKRSADYVAALKEAVGKKALPTLATALALPADKATDENRALLWGAARLLVTGGHPSVAKLFLSFSKAVRDGREPEKAYAETFAAAATREVEAAWVEFVRGL